MNDKTEAPAKTALKKSDLLTAVKESKDKTVEQISKKLAKSHSFLPEFLSYLMAMYTGNGKIAVSDEGFLSIQETGQVRTEPRPIFKLNKEGDGFDDKMLAPGEKLPEYWSLTKNTATKAAKSEAYAVYKARVAVLDEMAKTVADEPAEEAKAA